VPGFRVPCRGNEARADTWCRFVDANQKWGWGKSLVKRERKKPKTENRLAASQAAGRESLSVRKYHK